MTTISAENDVQYDTENVARLSSSVRGSINISGVTLTPTDNRESELSQSSAGSNGPRQLSTSKRKPLMHPTMSSRCLLEHSNEVSDNCGNNSDTSNENFNPSATYFRQKYYSRLTDPDDHRMRLPDHILPSSMFYVLPSKSEGQQSSIVTIFAIWNTMMGTSLLSMPWGLSQSGFTLGIFVIIFTGLLTLYTAYRIVKSREYVDFTVFEFSDVVRHYFGRIGECIAIVFGLLAFIGGMIVYWVLMTNFLYMIGVFIHEKTVEPAVQNATNVTDVLCFNAPEVANTSGVGIWNAYHQAPNETTFRKFWNVTRTVPAFLILAVFPFLNFQSATFFTKFNCLGTISVFYLWIMIIIKASHWGIHMNFDFDDVTNHFFLPQFRITFPALTGMLSLAFFLHNAVITILRNNRKPENNIRDLSAGYLLVMLTYLFVGILFYVSFPLPKQCISSNLLDNLSSNDPLAVGARALLLFQMLTVFPLLAYIFRVQVLHAIFGNIWPGAFHVVGLNVLLVAMCMLIAMFYPHIGDIIRYSGSLCGLVYIFVLPAAVHMIAMHKMGKLKIPSAIFHSFIIVVGVGNFLAQFLISPSK